MLEVKRVLLLICALSVTNGKLRNFKRPSSDRDDGKSSLVFVFDTTGSMHNDLKQLKEEAEMILKTALDESDVISDFVFVPFHDPTVGPATVTRNIHTFKTALNIVRVHGGGDCPEKSLTAIQLALKISRPKSFIYVFTDASAGDHRLVGKVLDAVQRQQSQVVFVLTGHCNDLTQPSYTVYQQIAAASSGQVFNLKKSNVHKVLEFVRSSIKGRTVNLASASNPAGYNHTQEIPVDSTLGEVTVSVSGSKPQITVVNPVGEKLTGPPKLITTLDLSEIMVVKVMQPEPGNWTITVGSEKNYSVKVVGLSNLTFNHGFSVQKPATMAETSYRPLRGAYNYMLLSLTQNNVSAIVEYASVLDLAGNTLFEVQLKEIDALQKVYLANPFIPPDDFFYIAINGRDQYGQELRRIGATAIQPKLPDVPYLTTSQMLEAHSHSRIVLTCNVESLVPVTAGWTKDSKDIQPQISSLQTTSVEYVIENMSEGHVGKYQCIAQNIAGNSSADTDVVLLVERPQVRITPENNTTVDIGENVTISCLVNSEVLVLKSQLVFNGTGRHYAVDFNLKPNIDGFYKYNITIQIKEIDSGLYSCIAVNRGGKTNLSTIVTVMKDPTAQIIGPHEVSRLVKTSVQLVCAVERAAAVEWRGAAGTLARRAGAGGTATDVLEVHNVTEDDTWKCTAIRGSRNGSDSVHVTVVMKPNVTVIGPKNITVLNGTVHEVVCQVTAKPAPRILWHRETEKFLNHTITELSPNVYKSVLTLNSSAENIAGTYFCFGENSEGIHQDNVTVNVRRKMTVLNGFTNLSVELYYQVELECQVDSYPPPRIRWYHNGTELTTHENVNINEDNTTVYLKRVNFDDLGSYICEADNGFEGVKVNGTLSVHGLAYPVLSKETTRVVARTGQSTIITCRVLEGNPLPLTSWQYKNRSAELFANPPPGVVVDNDKSGLVISNVSVAHGGVYRCTADNVLGRDYHDVELVVHYPPRLSPSNETLEDIEQPQEVKMGDKVMFSCDVIGLPLPIIVWTKDMKPIVYSKNVFVSEASHLVVSKVSEYDAGMYACNATSSLGAVQRNFTLIVYEPPSIPSEDPGPNLEIVEGQLVEMPCAARGLPAPLVQWTRDGQALNDTRKYTDDHGLRFVANLTDFGEYVCTAQNAYGNTTIKYSLYVWVPPYIEPPLESIKEVLLGANVSMSCDVIGYPIPTVQWEFNEQLIEVNTDDVSYNSNGEISIKGAMSKHEGVYSCVAENVAGIAKKSIYLKVNEPPKILEDNYTGSYLASNMDSVLTVACRATGKPKPYFNWSKDEFYLDKDPRYAIDMDGTLTIKSPSEDMSGNYTCTAKNEVGAINKTVPVEIYSLPTRVQSEESLSTVTLVEGARASVVCPVPASPADTVKWYKNAKLISTGILQFPNVSRENASSYSCVVSNMVGSAYSPVVLGVQWAPRLPPAAARQAVTGTDVYLDCDADAKPTPKTKWFFNSKPLVFEDKSRLKLINVQQHNAGTYKCVVSNVHGTVFRAFTLNTLVPPFISEFDMLDVQLKEGVNATLECNAKGTPAPTVTWTFNNTKWVQQNTSLTSVNISTSSEGLYRCDAVNEAGAAHIVYRVGVVAPAGVTDLVVYRTGVGKGEVVAKVVELVQGSNSRIACSAAGNPIPGIQWIKHGRLVSENAYDINYADLTLNDVQSAHAGVYTCLATNEGGSSERKVKIDVLEPPKIFRTLFQNTNDSSNEINLEVISGQAFYLHCHPYGNPLPEVYWFRDDVPLKLFDDTMVSHDFGEVIMVKNAIEEQSGNYTCVARNKVGNTSVVYLVDVLVPPPTPKETSKKVAAHYGRPVNLTCPVEGSPLPMVMWIKHPYTEINENSTRFILSDDGYAMIINNTQVPDSGKYSCIMTNKVGTTEVVFELTVEKPPTIAGNVGNNIVEGHVVQLRRSIVLKCEVDGHPMPKIHWLKDTQRLGASAGAVSVHGVNGSSVVAVWRAAVRDAGQYICRADNVAGTAHRRYNIAVQVPGKWSTWASWTSCNVTCGLGYQFRSRVCQYIDNDNNTIDNTTKSDRIILDESACKGPTVDRRKCHMPSCDMEWKPRWSAWSRWAACSRSCGAGTQARTRHCRTRAPCQGDNVQIRKCPGLPRCEPLPPSDNEVYDSKEDTSDVNSYLPEVTFETQPEIVNSHYSSDIEEFYSVSGSQPPTVFFDVNVTENLDRSYRGRCDPGYTYNTTLHTCDDIDECLIENNHCHSTQVCVNTAGAYRCTCPPGYLALGAGQRCLDINECEQELDGCEYSCVNTAGGYVCACPRHLRLHLDRHHCVIPALYRRPYGEFETGEYISTTVDFPTRYNKPIRNT